MIYMKWLVLAVLEKFMDVINIFTAPIVVLFADDEGWLPGWLYWWQTPDHPVDGDEEWQEFNAPFSPYDPKVPGFKRWANRVRWLYRNSMWGFAINVLGIKKTDYRQKHWILTTNFYRSNPNQSAKNDDWEDGCLRWWLRDDNGKLRAWQIYLVWPYWNKSRIIRLNIGWKLWGWYDDKWGANQIVLSLNPWKKYKKGG